MRRALCKVFGVGLLVLTAGVWSVLGQTGSRDDGAGYYNREGRLNVWTTGEVLRQKTGQSPEFLRTRFGRHGGSERIVFELRGDLIGYHVAYGRPPFQAEDGGRVVKVRGRAFVEITLYPVTSSDENIEANERMLLRQHQVKTALIAEVKPVEWFEGELRHVVGLRRRAPFRVRTLSNPTRLVVEFRR